MSSEQIVRDGLAAGDADAVIIDAVNEKTITWINPTPVSMGDSLGALALAGIDANQVVGAFNAAGPLGVAGVQKWATAGLEFNHPATVQLLDGLVTAGTLTQDTRDLLFSLSEKMISVWEQENAHGDVFSQSDLDIVKAKIAWDDADWSVVVRSRINQLVDDELTYPGDFTMPPSSGSVADLLVVIANAIRSI